MANEYNTNLYAYLNPSKVSFPNNSLIYIFVRLFYFKFVIFNPLNKYGYDVDVIDDENLNIEEKVFILFFIIDVEIAFSIDLFEQNYYEIILLLLFS